MTSRASLALAGLCLVASTALSAQEPAFVARPILVQGAMKLETEKLIGRLQNVKLERFGGWSFWLGTLDGHPVVVSRTGMGMTNSSAATALAAERYHPMAIVNQGTAGGHDPALRNYDIVLGQTAVSIAAFKSPFRKKGEGSRPLEWKSLDMRGSAKSGGEDLEEGTLARFPADRELLAVARAVTPSYKRARVILGVIGSSDIWHEELDFIALFHARYSTSVEEMETASAAQVAHTLGIPFLGIRIVTANVTNGEAYDPKTAAACQDFAYDVVKAYIRSLKP